MPEQSTASTPERIHEPFVMNIRPIVITGIVLFVIVVLLLPVLYWALVVMKNRSERTDAIPNPVSLGQQIPPEPRLQPSLPHQTLESQDLVAMRIDENRRLNQYSRDPKTGEVHIPISRAMKLLLQQQQSKPQPAGAVGAAR